MLPNRDPCQQNENSQSAYLAIDAEHRRYKGLFDFAHVGYLITDMEGTIKEANISVSTLLKSDPIGVSLAGFLERTSALDLKLQLNRLKSDQEIIDWRSLSDLRRVIRSQPLFPLK